MMEHTEKQMKPKRKKIKILTIGDIHGKSVWNEIIPENYDKIIFVGDYVDSFYDSDITIINNPHQYIHSPK